MICSIKNIFYLIFFNLSLRACYIIRLRTSKRFGQAVTDFALVRIMNIMKTLLLVLLTTLSLTSFSQIKISGTIESADTHEPLAYASVRINESNSGSLSDESGWFELVIPKEYVKDSVQFSYVGYESQSYSIKNFKEKTISLKPSKYDIDEVVVTPINADSIMVLVKKNYQKNHVINQTKQNGFMRTKFWESDNLGQIGETAYSVYYTQDGEKSEQEVRGLKSRIVIDSTEFKKVNEVFNFKRDTLLLDPLSLVGIMQQNSEGGSDEKDDKKLDISYEYLGREIFQGREAYRIGLKATYKGREFMKGTSMIDFDTYAYLSVTLETEDGADIMKLVPFALRTALSIIGFKIDLKKMKSTIYYKMGDGVFDLDKGVVYLSINAARGGDWLYGQIQQEFYLNARKESGEVPKKDYKLKSEVVSGFEPDYFKEYFHLPTTEKTLEEIAQIQERNHEFTGSIMSPKNEKWLKKQERKGKTKKVEKIEDLENN